MLAAAPKPFNGSPGHAAAENFFKAPTAGYSAWLVVFYGKGSGSSDWNDADPLYGSRHLTGQGSDDGTLPRTRALVLKDMIGWKQMYPTSGTR